MAPILGIIASQNYSRITGSFESISTYTVTGSAVANVTISSIPSTYKHLQLRMLARETSATVGGQSQMRINGDSGANYTYHTLFGSGSAATSDGSGGYQWAYGVDRHTNGNDPANTFGATIFDFLDYTNTSKYKTLRAFGGYDANGTGQIRLHSALWTSTSAITSLYFENQGGGSYAVGTQFALYGIKG
jgi:hypothetical protein